MANKTEIIVDDVLHNPNTGYITVFVKSRNRNGSAEWFGPVKGYGVDANMFAKMFSGDESQMLTWIAQQHKQYLGAHGELTDKLEKVKGKVIG